MKKAQDALKIIDPDIFVGVEIRDWAAFHELTEKSLRESGNPRVDRMW